MNRHQNPSRLPGDSDALKNLIRDTLIEKNISRTELAKRLGYKNVTKGLRKLDNFLETLDAPTEEFVHHLITALEIPEETFQNAAKKVVERFVEEDKRRFRPIVQVIPTTIPSPIFIAAMVPELLNIQVPDEYFKLPFDLEITKICDSYRAHKKKYENFTLKWAVGKGFRYHRSYDQCLIFDGDCQLTEIVDKHIPLDRAFLKIRGKELPFVLSSDKE